MTRLMDRLRSFLRPQIVFVESPLPPTFDLADAEAALLERFQIAASGNTLFIADRSEYGIVVGSWRQLQASAITKFVRTFLVERGQSHLFDPTLTGRLIAFILAGDLPPLPAGVLPVERILR